MFDAVLYVVKNVKDAVTFFTSTWYSMNTLNDLVGSAYVFA